MWLIEFTSRLRKNAAISDTISGTYDAAGKGSLGISFWYELRTVMMSAFSISKFMTCTTLFTLSPSLFSPSTIFSFPLFIYSPLQRQEGKWRRRVINRASHLHLLVFGFICRFIIFYFLVCLKDPCAPHSLRSDQHCHSQVSQMENCQDGGEAHSRDEAGEWRKRRNYSVLKKNLQQQKK